MAQRLQSVLSELDFPIPELCALVLDGEAWWVDGCITSVDETNGPSIRAAALARLIPPGLVAEQHSAAWIWGASTSPPVRHEVCASSTARKRPGFGSGLNVREVVILHTDIAVLAGVAVTTPMRTAIDLARFVEDWTDEESRVVAQLLALGECTVLDCARAINRRRNLPNKKLALERLAGCVRP
jgi:hypothetical protein